MHVENYSAFRVLPESNTLYSDSPISCIVAGRIVNGLTRKLYTEGMMLPQCRHAIRVIGISVLAANPILMFSDTMTAQVERDTRTLNQVMQLRGPKEVSVITKMLEGDRGQVASVVLKQWRKWKGVIQSDVQTRLAWNNAQDVFAEMIKAGLPIYREAVDFAIGAKNFDCASYLLDHLDDYNISRLSHTSIALKAHQVALLKKLNDRGVTFPIWNIGDLAEEGDAETLRILLEVSDHFRELNGDVFTTAEAMDITINEIVTNTYHNHDEQLRDSMLAFLLEQCNHIRKGREKFLEKSVLSAAKQNNLSLIKTLLSHGGQATGRELVTNPVMAISGGGGKALSISVSRYATPQRTGESPLFYAIVKDNAEMVTELLGHGAKLGDPIEREPTLSALLGGAQRAFTGESIDIKTESGWVDLVKLARARGNGEVCAAIDRWLAEAREKH